MRRSKPAHGLLKTQFPTRHRLSLHRSVGLAVATHDLPVVFGHKTFFTCQRPLQHQVLHDLPVRLADLAATYSPTS